jgi:hypothetical protein
MPVQQVLGLEFKHQYCKKKKQLNKKAKYYKFSNKIVI